MKGQIIMLDERSKFPKGVRRFPRESIPKGITRFPRESISALTSRALFWMERGERINRKLGHIFLGIKRQLKHGEWEAYHRQHFDRRGFRLRTCEEWMAMARDDERSKIAESAILPSHPYARDIRVTTKQAQTELASAPKKDPLYKLPLNLTSEQRATVDALRKNKHQWLQYEKAIITLLCEPGKTVLQ